MLCLLLFGTSWAENITVIQPTGGTVSYEDWNFNGQDTVRLHNTPDDGYRFVRYIVKDTSGNYITLTSFTDLGTGETSYYFVKQDATITAEFERSAYSITVTNPAGGTVTASLSSASEGDKVNLSYTVNSGYIFRRFIVRKTSDNSEVSVINGNFNMPGSNVTVTAEFAPAHAITVSNPENGSITAPASAAAGDTVQISVGANAGYEVKDCTVTKTGDSGVSVSTSIIVNASNGKVYSFTMPDYPVTVSARTELKVCPITWNTADCTVNGPAQGHIGDEITFSVTPSDGYRVRTISVNGEKVYGIVRTAVSGNVYTYKMTLQGLGLASSYVVDVECNNEDNAGFPITKELGQQANVSVTNSAGEEITRAEGGEAVTIKLLNQDIIDYHGNTSGNVFYPTGTDPYTGKDSKLLSGNDTFTMPFCDMTVKAGGVAKTFNLTCSSSANGTITANGSILAAGLTVVLTITPDEGYMFENVIVDGQDVALYVDEGDDNSYIYSFTMPGHDVNVSAVFAILYKITYELDGGTLAEGVSNPATYTVEDAITLNNPAKDGYTFTGWTGSNGTTPQTSVTIPKGSTGDMSYTATWTANTYTVKFNANGGTGDDAAQEYTYDTAQAMTANAFTREGYTFSGWNTESDGTGTGYTDGQEVSNIATGGEVTLYAQWTATEYTITYELDGGTVETANPAKYTVETATFTLTNPTKDGYVFTGWTGTGLDGAAMSVEIAKGSTGNREYTATWTGGGSDPEGDVPVFKTYQMKLEGR
ncbi:MAG: InlB B-repeat-containing protein, partial [Synergistaceae bacterium]|nr:InlB B-repeat-containing protein [Synergistaceae bacterium]